MANLSEIRNLIKKGRVKQAVEKLEELTPEKYSNEYLLLAASFNSWRKNKIIGLDPPLVEWKKITYGILELISEIEKENKTGLELRKVTELKKYEHSIKIGYEILSIKDEKKKINLLLQLLQNESHTDVVKLDEINNYSNQEIQLILIRVLKKYEYIYKLLTLNTILLGVLIYIIPFFLGEVNIYKDVMFQLGSEDGDEDDDIDID